MKYDKDAPSTIFTTMYHIVKVIFVLSKVKVVIGCCDTLLNT